jgi:hypothetical protein
MSTLPAEFIELANELINDEFAAFRKSLVISKSGKYDPISDTEAAGVTYNMQAIPLDIKSASEIFDNVTNASLYVVAYKGATTPQDLDASFSCVYDGKVMTINAVENDAAGAVWYLALAK